MTNEIDFIKSELKKKGYPLENYVQSMLTSKKWRVQPHAYFHDKDTDKGRELDIKAHKDFFKLDQSQRHFQLNLLIQCKKILGNAWIFFSTPQAEFQYTSIQASNLARTLGLAPALWSFDREGTHFHNSDTIATNYCEIITSKNESNKQTNNIWECVITLIKSTCEEVEKDTLDNEQYLNETGYNDFMKSHYEIVNIYYPIIVFEGKMYDCKFLDDDMGLEEIEYAQLFIDYQSGRYKGEFIIEITTKDRFSRYLSDILEDAKVFDQQRIEIAKEYEIGVREAADRYFRAANISF
jgi:hypothetical protein